MENLFYFKKFKAIGGTEQFNYELAKKYKNKDITILYDEMNIEQLKRLSKYIRCIKRVPEEKYICKKAFFNFNIDAIDQIESTENYYAFVSHANYEELGYAPPIKHPKLNKFIAVSNFASDKLKEYANKLGKEIEVETIYNPLTVEPKEKVIHLISACRLEDKVKGSKRTQKLIEALDRYSDKTGKPYLWTIFTNLKRKVGGEEIDLRDIIKSKNVCILEGRLNIRPYIAESDYCIQLSNDMETFCYTINEALSYSVPIVTTPLSILNELPITDNEHLVLNWDCSNVDEIARQIFEKEVKPFEYTPPKDTWDKVLKGKSTYKNKQIEVQAIQNYWDYGLNKHMDKGELFTVGENRADYLVKRGRVKRI